MKVQIITYINIVTITWINKNSVSKYENTESNTFNKGNNSSIISSEGDAEIYDGNETNF